MILFPPSSNFMPNKKKPEPNWREPIIKIRSILQNFLQLLAVAGLAALSDFHDWRNFFFDDDDFPNHGKQLVKLFSHPMDAMEQLSSAVIPRLDSSNIELRWAGWGVGFYRRTAQKQFSSSKGNRCCWKVHPYDVEACTCSIVRKTAKGLHRFTMAIVFLLFFAPHSVWYFLPQL